MDEVRNRPAPPIEPLPNFAPYHAFNYDARNLRDPFAQLQSNPVEAVGGPDVNRPKQELEAFSLESLKMVGTLSRSAKIWALISAPNNMIYRLQVGGYIGQNYGKVTSITKEKIDLVETVPDGLGGWKNRNAQLALTQ